jgi:hypothetical protein
MAMCESMKEELEHDEILERFVVEHQRFTRRCWICVVIIVSATILFVLR